MEHATNTTQRQEDSARFALGIDTARDTLALALLSPEGKLRTKSVRNNENGLEELMAWLRRHVALRPVHACLEASGGYEEAAAFFLFDQGITVSVINPRQIKAYGEAQLRRSKTDRADAVLIARFCQKEQPAPWNPPAPEVRHLRDLIRALEALKQERDRIQNRIGHSDNDVVAGSFGTVLKVLQDQIATMEEQIEQHVRAHPDLERQRDLLVSIPGVGRLTAVVLLAELGSVTRFENARQAAAYAGLVPMQHESGTSVRRPPRLSKLGSSRLRKALFYPAMTALRYNEVVRHFGKRLLERGKAKKAIVGAAMRKLLHICFGVLRSGQSFDPAFHLTT